MPAHTVIVANYHRIGAVDPTNPLHRLHTVPTDVFAAQVDHIQSHGKVVSLDDVRTCRGLSDVNFVITFDDVPAAAMDGISVLLERDLPLTLSVCSQLANNGWGTRDKVYCIDTYADPDHVARAVRAVLPHTAGPDPISFYHLTKSDDLDPDLVTSKLIDPLFAGIESHASPFLDGNGYLSWQQIRDLAASPLVTVANHTDSHTNLAATPGDRLADEIRAAHTQIARHIGRPPRYVAVPFGRYQQRLAIDCIEILHPLNYHGILWVGQVANLVRAPYEHQLLQLTRLHTPTTLDDFVAQLATVLDTRLDAAVWQVPGRRHSEPVAIVESSDQQRSARFEMVVRQGKDYASSPQFYRHLFTNNPAKGQRPDFYAVERAGRIEATAYNAHAFFRFGEVTVPGVYLASWRKLPESHPTAAGRLIHAMTTREAVVGVHRPSRRAEPAFRHWHRIPVWRLNIPVTDIDGMARLDRTAELDRFDDAILPLTTALTREAGFSLARDPAFYRWRHETYPLATCRYVLLYRHDLPVAYAVLLQCGDRLQIADWYATSVSAYTQLVLAVHDSARAHAAVSIDLDTSDQALARALATRFPSSSTTSGSNFYHLNVARLAELGVTEVDEMWSRCRFHETATTGDVLIR